MPWALVPASLCCQFWGGCRSSSPVLLIREGQKTPGATGASDRSRGATRAMTRLATAQSPNEKGRRNQVAPDTLAKGHTKQLRPTPRTGRGNQEPAFVGEAEASVWRFVGKQSLDAHASKSIVSVVLNHGVRSECVLQRSLRSAGPSYRSSTRSAT